MLKKLKPTDFLIITILFVFFLLSLLGNKWGENLVKRRGETLLKDANASIFTKANNIVRWSDVENLLEVIQAYVKDNNGVYPPEITTSVRKISKTEADICHYLIPKYISTLPRDPNVKVRKDPNIRLEDPQNEIGYVSKCDSSYDTGYTVVLDSGNGVITVNAPHAELEKNISVSSNEKNK